MNSYPTHWWQFSVAYIVMGIAALFLVQSVHCQEAFWEPVKFPVLHAGTWQSCNGEERSLEHWGFKGRHYVPLWELHMGPGDEFALYEGIGPSGEHAHDTLDNLLGSAYRINAIPTMRGARQWSVPRLHVWLSIVRAGGSREECQSFAIRVEHR